MGEVLFYGSPSGPICPKSRRREVVGQSGAKQRGTKLLEGSASKMKKGGGSGRPGKKPAAPDLDDCTIPPAIPRASLPNLLFNRDQQAESEIRRYVEWQAHDESVQHAERVTTEVVLGRRLDAWDVHTDKGRWWVITSPTNLYSQELFPSLDYAISFHVGVTARVVSQPDSGVSPAEEALMASAWRRWEQAAEALEEAEEAEDFQSVGMRCRECLIAMVKEVAAPEMVPSGETAPQRSNVVTWCELIANNVARGESAQHVRGYLKAISKSGWQMVNWLTHTSGATQADAVFALDSTQHVLSMFGTALFRHVRGIPDRCPKCGSYRIGLWKSDAEDDDAESVVRCQACGTFCDQLPTTN